MKVKLLLAILLGGLILMRCQFNQSVEKDWITGAYSRGNGLGCDAITLQVNGEAVTKPQLAYGEKLEFIFNNIKGFKKEDGKVFPGLSLHLVKNEKDTILHYPDLLASVTEGTDLSPLELRAKIFAKLPYHNHESYKAYLKIWDKKGSGTFCYELPFSVRQNELFNVNVSADLGYSNIYLWNKEAEQAVSNGKVNATQAYSFVLEGVKGMTVIEEMAFPALAMEITDAKGNKMMSVDNVLKAYAESGVPHSNVEDELPISINFTAGEIHNPCQFTARLTDLKSDKYVEADAALIIK